MAIKIWKFFGEPTGIRWEDCSITAMLSTWWGSRTKNILHMMLMRIISIVICWELWKARCATRYGGNRISIAVLLDIASVQYFISIHLRWVILKHNVPLEGNTQWKYICDRLVSLIPRIKSMPIKWMKPPANWIEVNTDGSSFNDGRNGGRGIVRHYEAKLVLAFSQ